MIRISDAGDGVGIPFRLLGNATTASIRDREGGFTSIFEEHVVVESLKDYRPGSQVGREWAEGVVTKVVSLVSWWVLFT